MRAAVFLDRDDTLIASASVRWNPGERPGDLADPARVELLPGVLEGCRMLREAGLELVVITNQGLVARGGGTLADVERVNDRMRELLVDEDGFGLIGGVYACPMHPQGTVGRFTSEHSWRKPAGGMLLAASLELELDLATSFVIGDAERDVLAGVDAGISKEHCLLLGRDAPDFFSAALSVLGRRSTARSAPEGSSTARLRAHWGSPLADDRTRETVVSAARALAERTGLKLLALRAGPEEIEVTVAAPPVAAIGFLAELRRLTNHWHLGRYGSVLWPEEHA